MTGSRTVLDTSTSLAPAKALTRAPMCTAIPPMSSPRTPHSPVCKPARTCRPECLHRVANRHRAANRPLRAVEHREEAIARRVHLAASKPGQLRPDDGVVRVKQGVPVTVAHLRRPARRVHDVGEEHGGENTVVRDVCLLAGEKLGDLLEGGSPWFYKVVCVAPGSSTYFAPDMWSATYLPAAGTMNRLSV